MQRRGGFTLTETTESLEKAFLESPNAERLVEYYEALKAENLDDNLAGVLDKVRPIQHRITLIQADATAPLLEALARDPHVDVRQVVASHPHISEEVCFRLSEDQQPKVRLALRKNPECHPLLAAAIQLEDGPSRSSDTLATSEHLIEASWQARRAGLKAKELLELCDEWLGVGRDTMHRLTIEQANLLLEVLAGKLGEGPMPRKRPKKKAKTKKRKK